MKMKKTIPILNYAVGALMAVCLLSGCASKRIEKPEDPDACEYGSVVDVWNYVEKNLKSDTSEAFPCSGDEWWWAEYRGCMDTLQRSYTKYRLVDVDMNGVPEVVLYDGCWADGTGLLTIHNHKV